MKVEIVTPEAILWEGEATSVVVPSTEGDLGILPGRQPVLAVLRPGTVRVISDAHNETFDVVSGFVSCDDDRVEIVVDNSPRG